MTDTSREAVERLLNGVTPGPWVYMGYPTEDPNHAGWYIVPFTAVGTIAKVNPHFGGDARFIAAARDLVPALLARAEAAEEKLKTAEEIGRGFEEDAGQLREKLAKAVEALTQISRIELTFPEELRPTASAALAQIKEG